MNAVRVPAYVVKFPPAGESRPWLASCCIIVVSASTMEVNVASPLSACVLRDGYIRYH